VSRCVPLHGRKSVNLSVCLFVCESPPGVAVWLAVCACVAFGFALAGSGSGTNARAVRFGNSTLGACRKRAQRGRRAQQARAAASELRRRSTCIAEGQTQRERERKRQDEGAKVSE